MTPEELERLTLELLEDFEDIKIRLGRIGKFSPEAVKECYNIIVEVLQLVEDYSVNVKLLSSEEKKQVAVKMLNDIVDIPWVPEFVEGAMIGWSIDLGISGSYLYDLYIIEEARSEGYDIDDHDIVGVAKIGLSTYYANMRFAMDLYPVFDASETSSSYGRFSIAWYY